MRNRSLRLLVSAALFAALTAVFTAFVKIPIGTSGGGYLHFGDSLIYLAASLLPFPYCMGAAAIGGAFADVMAGAAAWALPTAVIKACNTIPFVLMRRFGRAKEEQILTKGIALMPVLSGGITIGGYFVAESLLYGVEAATVSLPFSVIQAVGSAVLFYLAAFALDRVSFQRFMKG